MNYRHGFHAGNHADVLKHVVLLALCDALVAKPAPCFALDTHAGRGRYKLDAEAAKRTGEAEGGIGRLRAARAPAIARYLAAIDACRAAHGANSYPGSPWLLANALREQDRLVCCEIQPDEFAWLKTNFLDRTPEQHTEVTVQQRDGYAAMKALLPPRGGDGTRIARGLVLIDPPYESQMEEFDTALAALRDAIARWPQATYVLWYPIKVRRALHAFHRAAGLLPAKSALIAELRVRDEDSPLRMNGSGLLVLNPPWKLDAALKPALHELADALGEEGRGGWRVEWLREPA
ncbi:ribosomal RNA large subunit methyltransferase J [Lysobacter helvus]|uniref:Ribosomal RNA large subunit methyltransferase J n=2 Tax=Lysobacteraceae TaxID=32033 RepID=A0ABN6FNY3_9GAMM|nr:MULTISPECIES: 23S rRNA (adenine(2030)-N(6))-methyltransferase RlmJ [Lysobacter]BCT91271.1 ribosomal RNA large subunit methyltransferase J [Lysobacter caseinilyticus]BCT94424.1 ribosomal RNA large subunit methyltransferase J [Lysobacter helvus]